MHIRTYSTRVSAFRSTSLEPCVEVHMYVRRWCVVHSDCPCLCLGLELSPDSWDELSLHSSVYTTLDVVMVFLILNKLTNQKTE